MMSLNLPPVKPNDATLAGSETGTGTGTAIVETGLGNTESYNSGR